MHTHTHCNVLKVSCSVFSEHSYLQKLLLVVFDKHSTNYAALFDSLMYIIVCFSLCVSLLSCTGACKVDAVTRDNRRAEMRSPQKELSGIKSEGLVSIFFPKAHLVHFYLFTGSLT